MRPTVHDVAEEAGVSLATVDRVLNRRPGVRDETVARVEAAVARLGFVRDLAAANLAKQRIYRLVFILPDGQNSFMRGLEQRVVEAQHQSSRDRTEIRVISVPAFDGKALADALDSLDPATVSGVALVATESAHVRDALVRLHRAEIPVVTLVSDVPTFARSHYVGIDNVAAGRTAASLIGRFSGGRRGKIALIAGSMLVRDHVERRMGFEQVIRTEFPNLSALPVLEGRDDFELTKAVLSDCLQRESDVIGLYNIGAGNRGVLEVLSARQPDEKLVVVAHELSGYTKAALLNGQFDAIINQDAGHEVRSAIRVLKAHIDQSVIVDAQEHIRIEIYLRDNLP